MILQLALCVSWLPARHIMWWSRWLMHYTSHGGPALPFDAWDYPDIPLRPVSKQPTAEAAPAMPSLRPNPSCLSDLVVKYCAWTTERCMIQFSYRHVFSRRCIIRFPARSVHYVICSTSHISFSISLFYVFHSVRLEFCLFSHLCFVQRLNHREAHHTYTATNLAVIRSTVPWM